MGGFVRLVRRATCRGPGALGVALICATLALPLGILASHQFTDVPDSNIYHADIDALADAGVTTGCGDGSTYCPDDFVTREQMAAFMNRLGALGPGKVPVVDASRLDGLDSFDFVGSASVAQGTFICPGMTMMPGSDEADWSLNSNQKYFQTGFGALYCHVRLPQGATITGLYSLLFDASATLEAACHMFRYRTDTGAISSVGGTPSSGIAFSAGHITIGTTSVSNAVVDNTVYMYVGDCLLTGPGTALRVGGFAVTYEIVGLPVW